jgi:hypothetical protein
MFMTSFINFFVIIFNEKSSKIANQLKNLTFLLQSMDYFSCSGVCSGDEALQMMDQVSLYDINIDDIINIINTSIIFFAFLK